MEFANNSFDNNYSYDITNEQTTITMVMHLECDLPLAEGSILFVLNVILAIVGTFGNILIILAVLKSPRLRQKPSNFLLLSLAVADLLVTMIAQPLFSASIALKAFVHQCHRQLDLVYVIAAPLAGSSSVFHLAAISIDRSLSALKPHKHRDIIRRGLKIMLCACWGLSALVVCVLVIFPQLTTAVYVALLLCLAIMVIAYGMILYKILSNRVVNVPTSTKRDRAMEKRVSGTVAIIIFLFAVCWVPLIGFHLSKSSTKTASEMSYWWIRTLYLANSSMNFIVYSLRIKQFRSSYMKIINRGLRRFVSVLPEICRCQCVYTLDTRMYSQSTQHTPVSPTSTAVPLNMTIRDEPKINIKQKEQQKEVDETPKDTTNDTDETIKDEKPSEETPMVEQEERRETNEIEEERND